MKSETTTEKDKQIQPVTMHKVYADETRTFVSFQTRWSSWFGRICLLRLTSSTAISTACNTSGAGLSSSNASSLARDVSGINPATYTLPRLTDSDGRRQGSLGDDPAIAAAAATAAMAIVSDDVISGSAVDVQTARRRSCAKTTTSATTSCSGKWRLMQQQLATCCTINDQLSSYDNRISSASNELTACLPRNHHRPVYQERRHAG